MAVHIHKCGGCGDSIRSDDSPVAPVELRPRRMTFSVSGAPVLVVDLCAGCFRQAQDATFDRIADLAAAAAAPELARSLEGEDDNEHTARIDGGHT